jgi:glycosyltransferase involved in cell wall biosynthesis
MLANQEWDAVVAWEQPSFMSEPRIRENIKVAVCEMQVARFAPKEMQAAEEYCDYVAALSDWHAEFLLHSGLDMERDKVVVFPNGVDILRYPKKAVLDKIEDGKHFSGNNPQFVYSSSPDRGLWQLLQSWRYIRKAFPEAQLRVAYGVEKLTNILRWMHGRQGEMAVEIERLMSQSGVTDLGKIGQGELSRWQIGADAWLYPLDAIQATETGCITAVENAAAGNPLITTDCDCMESEFGPIGCIVELPFDAKEYADTVEYILKDENIWKDLALTGRDFAEKRDWSLIAPRWLTLFQKHQA